MHKSRNFFSAVTKKWLQHNFTDLKYIFVTIRNFALKNFWGQFPFLPNLLGHPVSSILVFVPIWLLWGSSKKLTPQSLFCFFFEISSYPKKVGEIIWGVNNWWCFLFTEKSQTSERKGPSLPGKKWESVLWMIFGFVSFQLQKIEFLVLYLTSWISPLGGPFRWGTSWDKDK